MARLPRRCLSCGELTANRSRCTRCTVARNATRDAARGTTAQRSYGAAHQSVRRRLLPLAYGQPCPRCGATMHEGQALDLGHSDQAAKRARLPGDRIEHALCNRSGRFSDSASPMTLVLAPTRVTHPESPPGVA